MVLSIQSMAGRLTYTTFIPLAGYLADRNGLLTGLHTIRIASLVVATILITLMLCFKAV